LTLHGDVRYLSPHYEGAVTATQLETKPGLYNSFARTQTQYVGDLSAALAFVSHVSVTGYVNVGNNIHKTNVILNQNFFPPPATPYMPRTYGMVLSVRW
jgi:hypothetical protein